MKLLPSHAGLVHLREMLVVVELLLLAVVTGPGASRLRSREPYTKSRSKPASVELAVLVTSTAMVLDPAWSIRCRNPHNSVSHEQQSAQGSCSIRLNP